jgi:hypothetical protein
MFLNEGINVRYMLVGFFHNIKLGFKKESKAL